MISAQRIRRWWLWWFRRKPWSIRWLWRYIQRRCFQFRAALDASSRIPDDGGYRNTDGKHRIASTIRMRVAPIQRP